MRAAAFQPPGVWAAGTPGTEPVVGAEAPVASPEINLLTASALTQDKTTEE